MGQGDRFLVPPLVLIKLVMQKPRLSREPGRLRSQVQLEIGVYYSLFLSPTYNIFSYLDPDPRKGLAAFRNFPVDLGEPD